MDSDLVRALCALAAFLIPLGLAWVIVMWKQIPFFRAQAARRARHSHNATLHQRRMNIHQPPHG